MVSETIHDETIAAALGWLDAGVPAVDVAEHFGLSTKTLYGWKRKFPERLPDAIGQVRALAKINKELEREVERTRQSLALLRASIKKNSILRSPANSFRNSAKTGG